MPQFYHFDQNNSGGVFIFNNEVSTHVIIEAHSALEANSIAEEHGIYFNGCDDGIDCDCCGDRWSRAHGEGTIEPLIYGQPIEEALKSKPRIKWNKKGETEIIVYYLNGDIKKY